MRPPWRPREPRVAIGDPRYEDWESVSTFEDERTALAWRDQLRGMGVAAACVADHPLDRGRGDVFLVVPPGQWSRATEILDNLETGDDDDDDYDDHDD